MNIIQFYQALSKKNSCYKLQRIMIEIINFLKNLILMINFKNCLMTTQYFQIIRYNMGKI